MKELTLQELKDIEFDRVICSPLTRTRQTCDIIRATENNTKAILDFLTNEKIEGLRAENTALKGQISNERQSAFIIDALSPKNPVSAYVVQPPQQVTFPTNCCGNVAYANYNNGNSGCGCC